MGLSQVTRLEKSRASTKPKGGSPEAGALTRGCVLSTTSRALLEKSPKTQGRGFSNGWISSSCDKRWGSYLWWWEEALLGLVKLPPPAPAASSWGEGQGRGRGGVRVVSQSPQTRDPLPVDVWNLGGTSETQINSPIGQCLVGTADPDRDIAATSTPGRQTQTETEMEKRDTEGQWTPWIIRVCTASFGKDQKVLCQRYRILPTL